MYQFAHYLWIGPLHVIAITVLLWLRLGPTSLIGVGVIVILTPFRGCLWKLSCNLRYESFLDFPFRQTEFQGLMEYVALKLLRCTLHRYQSPQNNSTSE